jgi:transcriptional regulator with GAF, ATPase, and Fis domain
MVWRRFSCAIRCLPRNDIVNRHVDRWRRGLTSTRTLADAERAHIVATLQTSWVIGGRRGAAAQLGLARTTLIARMKRLGITREQAGQSVPAILNR